MITRFRRSSCHGLMFGVLSLALSMASTATASSRPDGVGFETYVKSRNATDAVVTVVIIYEHEFLPLVRQATQSAVPRADIAIDARGKAHVGQGGKGAEIHLDPDNNYVEYDVPLSFDGPGVFPVLLDLDIELEGRVMRRSHGFWVKHDGADTTLVSFTEYARFQQDHAERVPSDPTKNLEEGDVPGVGVRAPTEPETGPRCGREHLCLN